jgi:hypothetical protein
VTGTAARGPEPSGQWSAARHRDLLDGLSRRIDPDAGLRDIMLHADHADLAGTLGGHLDTKAGLAAILPPPAAPSSRSTPIQPGAAAAIAAAEPEARIALRRDPVILAVILSDLTVRALTIAGEAETLDHANDHAHDLAGDIERARALNDDLGGGGVLDRHLTFARERTLALAFDLSFNLADNRDIHLVRDLNRALDLALDLDRVRDLDRALDRVRDLDRALDRVRDLDRALDRARDLARALALMVGDALGLRQVEGLAPALLAGALDDFTHADLARADLAGRDLTGVRWSDRGTTWPPGTDTGELRARSREIAPGTYEITRPGHGDKARHHTPA